MTGRPVLRILGEAGILLGLYGAGLAAMIRWRVMEQVLSPQAGSAPWVALAVVFLLLRFFLILGAPGWVLARLFLWAVGRREASPGGGSAAVSSPTGSQP